MIRLPMFLRRRPPLRALEWAAGAVGAGAGVVAVRRLRGGSSSAMHALDVVDAGGLRHRLVLRRLVRADWLAEEPDVAEREARVLRLLARSEVPAPRLVAFDADGSACDVPAVLMTRLPGRVDILPVDLDAWLRGLAPPLAFVHAVQGPEMAQVAAYAPYADFSQLQPPPWSRRPDAWSEAFRLLAAPLLAAPAVFIHRDYHPMNVLWSRGRLTGVIDWANASTGPAAIDSAHCRVNLVVMFGLEVADRFREACLAAGVPSEAYWDLVCLCDSGGLSAPAEDSSGGLSQFHDAGRTDLTAELVRGRLDDYVVALLQELD